MRLISCHITGFGRFTDYDYEFKNGLNTICEDNGWGKSTFSLFLKSMFYGLEVDTKGRSKADRVRVKYEPWDGGSFGGHLVFELDDKTYRVERTFAKKSKDDTCVIYDLTSNTITNEFDSPDPDDAQTLGDILFGVDEESFMKSIFVSQNQLSSSMTANLSAKMGNVTAKADISSFKEAEAKLVKKVESYYCGNARKFENTGRMNQIDILLKDINLALEKKPEIAQEIRANESKQLEYNKQLEAARKEKEAISDKIQKMSEHQQAAGAYNEQKKHYEECLEVLQGYDDFFANGIPTDEELDAQDDKERELLVKERELQSTLENMPLEDTIDLWKELFSQEISDEQFEEWNQKSMELKELRARSRNASLSESDRIELQGHKFYFAKKHPMHEEISLVNEEATNVAARKAEYESLSAMYEDKNRSYNDQMKAVATHKPGAFILSMTLAVIIIVAGVAGLVFLPGITGMSVFAAGVGIGVVMIIGATLIRNRRLTNQAEALKSMEAEVDDLRSKYEAAKNNYETSEKIVNDFLSNFGVDRADSIQQNLLDITSRLNRYDYLLAQEEEAMVDGGDVVEQIAAASNELYYQLDHYAGIYGMNLHEDQNDDELLLRLKEDYRNYESYLAKDKARSEIIQESDKLKKEVIAFIMTFPIIEEDTRAKKLSEIRRRASAYDACTKRAQELKEGLEEFKAHNEVFDETVSIEELQESEREYDEVIEELHSRIAALKQDHGQLSDEMIACEYKEAEKEDLLQERAEVEELYKISKATLDYLRMAKDNFQAKYIKPLQTRMSHYVDMIFKDESKLFNTRGVSLDMDLKVVIDYHGSSKNSEAFSQGIKDMISLCSRFALVDVLYENEVPFMVLDDPFTNLDPDKIDEAINLLKDLSDSRQIIYFTCHESRT